MRHLYQLIIITCLFITLDAQASSLFIEPLYWQAREPYDWASVNNLNSTNHQLTYQTLNFNFAPGMRVGGELSQPDWSSRFYFTYYHTNNSASVTGPSISSGLLGARIALLGTGGVYTAEQAQFSINYNVFDWDINKPFQVNDSVMVRPSVGLRGGTINQTIITDLQGSISVTETAENNFKGIGPKAGIETKITLLDNQAYKINFIGSFVPAYLWGHWKITDILIHKPRSAGADVDIDVAPRDFGSLSLQAMIGASMDYKNVSASLNYEIQDWFNQFQIFDNGTGGHSNDLYLHGISFNMTAYF